MTRRYQFPPSEWECPECGSMNPETEHKCQWCDNLGEVDREAIAADHRIDQRKHER